MEGGEGVWEGKADKDELVVKGEAEVKQEVEKEPKRLRLEESAPAIRRDVRTGEGC